MYFGHCGGAKVVCLGPVSSGYMALHRSLASLHVSCTHVNTSPWCEVGSDYAPFGLNGVFIRPLSLVWLLTVFWLKHENKTWEALTWVFLSRGQERKQSQCLYQVCVTLLRAFHQTCCWKNIYYNINKREKSNACETHCYQCRPTTLLITILFTDFFTPKGKILSVRFFYLEPPVGPLGTVSTRRQLSFTQNPCVADKMKVCNWIWTRVGWNEQNVPVIMIASC